MQWTRLLALGGIAAPLLYVGATVLTVWLKGGDYSLTLETASQLSTLDQPWGLMFILAGAVPVGFLNIAFAYSIWFTLPETQRMHFGVILLSFESMAIIVGYGVFPRYGADPGVLHLGSGAIALACGLGARLLLARPLQHMGAVYFPLTLAVAIATPALLLGGQLTSSPGLYERTGHALVFVWMLAIAVPIALRPEEYWHEEEHEADPAVEQLER